MTRPLRRAHRWIWTCLAIALPILFAIGLLARRPPTPPNPRLDWGRFK